MADLIKMLTTLDPKNVKQLTQLFLTLKGYWKLCEERMPDLDFGTRLRRSMRDEEISTKLIHQWNSLERMFENDVHLELFVLVHLAILSWIIATFRTNNVRESWLAIALCIATFTAILVARNVVMFHAMDMFEWANVMLSILRYVSISAHGTVWAWFMATAREQVRDMLADVQKRLHAHNVEQKAQRQDASQMIAALEENGEIIQTLNKEIQVLHDEIRTLKDRQDKARPATRSRA